MACGSRGWSQAGLEAQVHGMLREVQFALWRELKDQGDQNEIVRVQEGRAEHHVEVQPVLSGLQPAVQPNGAVAGDDPGRGGPDGLPLEG